MSDILAKSAVEIAERDLAQHNHSFVGILAGQHLADQAMTGKRVLRTSFRSERNSLPRP